jgi:hypothetical protein
MSVKRSGAILTGGCLRRCARNGARALIGQRLTCEGELLPTRLASGKRAMANPGVRVADGHGHPARFAEWSAGPMTICEHTAIRRVDSHSALEAALGARERVRGRRAGGIGWRVGAAGPRVSGGLSHAASVAPIALVAPSPEFLVFPTDHAHDPSERLTRSPDASSVPTITWGASRDSRSATAEGRRRCVARPIRSLPPATMAGEPASLPRECKHFSLE